MIGFFQFFEKKIRIFFIFLKQNLESYMLLDWIP